MGTPDFAVPVLKSLLRSSHDVLAVYTRPDRPAGRGRQPMPSPVKREALSAGLRVLQPPSLKDEAPVQQLQLLRPDLIVVAAFAYLLPPDVLAAPLHGCLNVHPSLLPRYRGPSPIASALLNGDAETGVSIMLMDSGLDTGPVLSQERVPIDDACTTGTLTMLLAERGARLLVSMLDPWLDGCIRPWPQDSGPPRTAPGLRHGMDCLTGLCRRWCWPPGEGIQPWPGSYTVWNGQRLKVHRAEAQPLECSESREQWRVAACMPGGSDDR
jgi:methionyl-tRNA formyltransferase